MWTESLLYCLVNVQRNIGNSRNFARNNLKNDIIIGKTLNHFIIVQ
jgi:hypothetical protein